MKSYSHTKKQIFPHVIGCILLMLYIEWELGLSDSKNDKMFHLSHAGFQVLPSFQNSHIQIYLKYLCLSYVRQFWMYKMWKLSNGIRRLGIQCINHMDIHGMFRPFFVHDSSSSY